MAEKWLSDEQVEEQIAMLRTDPMVQLARKEHQSKVTQKA